jgi:anti-anti-sigma factor
MQRIQQEFSASVRYLSGSRPAAIIDLQGEVDGFAEAALNEAYTAAEAQSPEAILLNFGAVDYINSTGIALIVALLARARRNQQRLLSFGLDEHYEEIFRITRLADFIDVHPDETSALEAIAAG